MGAGRRPKPAEIKKLQGTDRSDRANGGRMDPSKIVVVPDAPEYLDKHGKELWNNQLKQLSLLKMLTEVDLVALAQYCKEYDLYRDALDDINENGFVNKHDQISPAVSVKNQAFKNMLQIADRFGFVASARENITMPEEKEQDPLEMHMAKIHDMNSEEKKSIEEWATENKLHGRIVTALTTAGIKTLSELSDLNKKSLKKNKGYRRKECTANP